MSKRFVLTSSSKDAHGLTIPKERLIEFVDSINSPFKMRYIANHKREYPIAGFLDKGELIENENVDLVVAESVLYASQQSVDWDLNLVTEKLPIPIQFKKRTEFNEPFVLTLDPNNFKTPQIYFNLEENILTKSKWPITVETDTRKGYIPEPRIIFSLAIYWTAIHPFVKPLVKKMGEKFAEDFAADVYKFTKKNSLAFIQNLKSIISSIRKNSIPADKPMMVIFEIPGQPFIELHAKTDDVDKIAKGLSANQLAKMHNKLNDLKEKIEIEEAHFTLDEKGRWHFTYLVAIDGTQLGTRAAFKKRDDLLKRINLSPTKGHSIGANVTYQYTSNRPQNIED